MKIFAKNNRNNAIYSIRIQKKRADHHDLPVFLVVGLEKVSWFRAILIVAIRNIMSGYTGPAAMMTIAHLSELKNL